MVVGLAPVDLSKEIIKELANNRSEILLIKNNKSEKIIVLNNGNELAIKTLEGKDESKNDGITTVNASSNTGRLGRLTIFGSAVYIISQNVINLRVSQRSYYKTSQLI